MYYFSRLSALVLVLSILACDSNRIVDYSRTQKLQPHDSLYGLPFVTAQAWAIVDGHTGEILREYNGNQPRYAASTTKSMTGFLILDMAKKNPAILEEIVTISPRAAKIGGSTAKVEAGDKLSVRELLYGMFLPSGNNAGSALGEHFNGRLIPATAARPGPVENFMAAMNVKANELGMHNTWYQSTFGDGGKGSTPTITACDLARLGFHAMKNPLFRRYVGTQEYVGTIQSADGSKREQVWKNTNPMLEIEGFDGIKTGFTRSAKSCLLSSCRRNGDHLIVTVLGCPTTASRNCDTQNLLRWAFKERGHI
jgi:serine-type D-Ala-D-Ala carboxypeptidase (penicillin-binding protein 5/6)